MSYNGSNSSSSDAKRLREMVADAAGFSLVSSDELDAGSNISVYFSETTRERQQQADARSSVFWRTLQRCRDKAWRLGWLGWVFVALLFALIGIVAGAGVLYARTMAHESALSLELMNIEAQLGELKQNITNKSEMDELKAFQLIAALNSTQEQIEALKHYPQFLTNHTGELQKSLAEVSAQNHAAIVRMVSKHAAGFRDEITTIDGKFGNVFAELANLRQNFANADLHVQEILEHLAATNASFTESVNMLEQREKATAGQLVARRVLVLDDLRDVARGFADSSDFSYWTRSRFRELVGRLESQISEQKNNHAVS